MLMAVDVGNTNITIGFYDKDELVATKRASTAERRTSDEIAVLLFAFMDLADISPSDVDAVIVSSVVPKIMHSLKNAIVKYLHIEPLIVGPGIKTGISVQLDNPALWEQTGLPTVPAPTIPMAARCWWWISELRPPTTMWTNTESSGRAPYLWVSNPVPMPCGADSAAAGGGDPHAGDHHGAQHSHGDAGRNLLPVPGRLRDHGEAVSPGTETGFPGHCHRRTGPCDLRGDRSDRCV